MSGKTILITFLLFVLLQYGEVENFINISLK